jgi:hypothetical protein
MRIAGEIFVRMRCEFQFAQPALGQAMHTDHKKIAKHFQQTNKRSSSTPSWKKKIIISVLVVNGIELNDESGAYFMAKTY